MKKRLCLILCFVLLTLSGCQRPADQPTGTTLPTEPSPSAPSAEPGGTFGENLEDLNAYAGYFEGNGTGITVECVSGTPGSYRLDRNVLTFTNVREDSVYSVSGQFRGSIVVDIGDDHKFDLELKGLSLISCENNPIIIHSGDEVSITAKSEYENYIYDLREAVDPENESLYSGAIHAEVDLEICGKGSLTVISQHNKGIHTKDDLQVKNLTLLVACRDNALKGNDSVEIKGGSTTLIATAGDGIKTSNSDISGKGNQRGTISIRGGVHTIYAACDGLDAAYNVEIDESSTQLSICTDKYSHYSAEVTATDENRNYIRFTYSQYQYSVKYYNSDEDYFWVNAEYHSTVSGGRSTYYYYAYPKMPQYSKVQFFIYDSNMQPGQEQEYLVASDYLTPNQGYDTFALTAQRNSLAYQWTNYTTSIQQGGPGGFDDGNTDKGDYSTKGIKAGNEILIRAGIVNIKSYDDAIHANKENPLENGKGPTGNVTVTGGILTVFSHDDGIHADGTLTIGGGTVCVAKSYEGLEGAYVQLSGGTVSITASDDGINATATADTAIQISGGTHYICCTGDGIDANSRSPYSGIHFSGGYTVVISNSGMNSALDTEQGYRYTGGAIVAIMPSRSMVNEAVHCSNFESIGTYTPLSLTSGSFLTVTEGNTPLVTVEMPMGLDAFVVYLGSNSASITASAAAEAVPDDNGVCWFTDAAV